MTMWDEDRELELADELPEGRTETVLVVVVPAPEDWETLLREGWYRIPLRCAPRRVGADYLAFYHPQVFANLRWTIRYYAQVRRYRIVRRRELFPQQPDHPRADDLYYRIDVGPLQQLPRPIVSRKLRRVTFIPTTLPRLLQAREINDLWLRERGDARWGRVRHLGEPS